MPRKKDPNKPTRPRGRQYGWRKQNAKLPINFAAYAHQPELAAALAEKLNTTVSEIYREALEYGLREFQHSPILKTLEAYRKGE